MKININARERAINEVDTKNELLQKHFDFNLLKQKMTSVNFDGLFNL